MTLAKIKQYPTKEEDAINIVWGLKRPLLNTLRKIISTVQQRNSKSVEKEFVSASKGLEKKRKDPGKRSRLDGGGQKLTYVELEEEVLSWMQQRRSNMLRVSRKFIMFKAKSIYGEKCGNNQELKV